MIRAIQTPYRGITFASTLEADWAKTLDALRISWQYEPEGVTLPDRQNYRCDFYLPHLRTWLEVKGPHDARIDKPALLARALLHAPACDLGNPATIARRPDSVAAARCPCRFGPDYPYGLVVIGRPATHGKLTFEAAHGMDQQIVLLSCPTCRQHSFIDGSGVHICRRCLSDANGAKAWPSGGAAFHRVEPPRGGRRAPGKPRAGRRAS